MSASLIRWGVVGALMLASGWWALRAGAPGPLANAVDSAAASGLPPLERPAEAAHSALRIALGSKLFFDRRLSFNGSMSCAICHVPEQGFTSHDSRTGIGIGIEGESLRRNAPSLLNVAWQARLEAALLACATDQPPDLWRFEITLDPVDRFAFKTPSLRNVAQTALYRHDGSLATLEDVIDSYDRGGGELASKSERLRPLGLQASQKAALTAFLRTLDGSKLADLVARTRASAGGL